MLGLQPVSLSILCPTLPQVGGHVFFFTIVIFPTLFVSFQLKNCLFFVEQKQNMRDLSRGEGKKIKHVERNLHKKRKYQSTDRRSVQTAAKEFLEKAARELLGDNKSGFKGPLKAEASDEENLPVS